MEMVGGITAQGEQEELRMMEGEQVEFMNI